EPPHLALPLDGLGAEVREVAGEGRAPGISSGGLEMLPHAPELLFQLRDALPQQVALTGLEHGFDRWRRLREPGEQTCRLHVHAAGREVDEPSLVLLLRGRLGLASDVPLVGSRGRGGCFCRRGRRGFLSSRWALLARRGDEAVELFEQV